MINCLVGFSRSASVLIAALMIVRHWTLAHAFRALRLRRQVWTEAWVMFWKCSGDDWCIFAQVKPNVGFMAQLLTLEIQLTQQGIILVWITTRKSLYQAGRDLFAARYQLSNWKIWHLHSGPVKGAMLCYSCDLVQQWLWFPLVKLLQRFLVWRLVTSMNKGSLKRGKGTSVRMGYPS